ncbi:ABC transporter ATP-binding protein [Microbacterium betulae]|uniref:ABC transporter ATP-binding protein n=1 Tax=Microbacterium betulae TaxID=2981139 RepID=A0AA97FI81_9MICO|nr:ABC transporter ATP-binding protein [Microbacterium sp. AB]WOF23383.1 ABC transporter ATP-binding protein [Microbacterium sp. AB]
MTGLTISIGRTTIVDGISFSVSRGQRVCLLGQSGSGKSLTAGAVLGHLPSNAVTKGSIRIDGVEVRGVPAPRRAEDARVGMVFQDSAVALNPLVRIGDQLAEPLRRHRGLSRRDAVAAAVELAGSVGLPDPGLLVRRHPAELSGGQRQRVCIALALACDTGLIVADEPTTALDVVTQAKVLDVLKRYTAGPSAPALLFITHDLAVASELCDDAVVLKDGRIVEHGRIDALFTAPREPYTRDLVRAARAATVQPHIERLAALADRAAPATADRTAREGFFDIADVSRAYRTRRTGPFSRRERTPALHPTSLAIAAGERVGIVGASGSGKSTLLRLVLALEDADTGTVRCEDAEVFPTSVSRLKWYRRKVQYIPQDPASALDPLMTVHDLVAEPLRRLDVPCDCDSRVRDALDSVGLDERFLDRRASELSGGQAQRVAIARAIATNPDFLVADEPVSGLDLPMREQIVALLAEISERRGTGIIVVSHDLSMVASMCTRTIVMHGGQIVEDRPTAEILAGPRHERTRELLAAVPALPTVPEAGAPLPAAV